MFDNMLLHPRTRQAVADYLQNPGRAVLLAGRSGLGKSVLAQQLAAALLGVERIEAHPYCRVISGSNGSISIEMIRALSAFFSLQVPGKAAIRRLAVLDDAETMTLEAQNALLKMLEEPPKDTVLLMTATDTDRLLPTIRSRLTVLPLAMPAASDITAYFTARGYEPAAIERARLMSNGSLHQMQQSLETKPTTDSPDDVFDTVKQTLRETSFERLLRVDALAKDKAAAASFVTALIQLAHASLTNAASRSAASLTTWQRVLQAGLTASEALQKNGNAKLVLTDLMLAL